MPHQILSCLGVFDCVTRMRKSILTKRTSWTCAGPLLVVKATKKKGIGRQTFVTNVRQEGAKTKTMMNQVSKAENRAW